MTRTSRIRVVVATIAMIAVTGCNSQEWGDKYGAPAPTLSPAPSASTVASPTPTPATPAELEQQLQLAKAEYSVLLAEAQAAFDAWQGGPSGTKRRDLAIQYYCDSDRGQEVTELLYVEFGATRQFGLSSDGQEVITWLEGLDPIAFGAALQTCASPPQR